MAYLGVKRHSVHSLVFKWYSQKRFPHGSVVKKLPANARDTQEIVIQPLGWEHALKEEMATYAHILAWKTPWTEPGRLQPTGPQRVGHDCLTEHPGTHGQSNVRRMARCQAASLQGCYVGSGITKLLCT